MSRTRRSASWRALIPLSLLALTAASCAGSDDSGSDEPPGSAAAETDGTSEPVEESESADESDSPVLHIGAIPDQEPERLQRTYGLLADHLEEELADDGFTTDVEYVPVTDYSGAVTGFVVGDLDAVWFGGLTGVQAQLEVEGAQAVAQRDIDEAFTSVFIAGADTGVETIDDVAGLAALEGQSFTFGSESSTSGRLMPQSFLAEAGIDPDEDFEGQPGFSGSHDATIELVAAGTYDVGALNSQVWDDRVADGTVDETAVVEVFRTPPYYDYHWVVQPDLDDEFGDGFTEAFTEAMTALDPDDPDDAEVLELFGAGAFIETENGNYAAIEAVGRDAGLIR
ncbi:putative selenate ABC transporter substrate-binding protein [Ilumatobacter nonamiensis]|uniref:putative selenate ABC transporter substrate-binding protein n=1 Tax=Ilumatobacter nonamiensis TaxID=467093 RepID=UPI00058C0D3E|nr:putative selenate ABC transporter substrate-binding protein [Ilumatobacter nonamiensis]